MAFRAGPQDPARNLEIPGSAIWAAQERPVHLDEKPARPYSRANDFRRDHDHRSPPPHFRGMGGRLRLRSSPLPPDRVPRLLPFPEIAV